MATNWTTADLAKLEAAIARGALRVEYQGQSVTYQSLDAMLRIRDQMRRELGITTAESGVVYAGRIG